LADAEFLFPACRAQNLQELGNVGAKKNAFPKALAILPPKVLAILPHTKAYVDVKETESNLRARLPTNPTPILGIPGPHPW
jgi:hypothetical protein